MAPPKEPANHPALEQGDPSGTAILSDRQIAWGLPSGGEHRWPATVAVLVAILLQIKLPPIVSHGLGPRWLLPSLEGLLALLLVVVNPGRITRDAARFRALGIALIALINLANVVSLVELLHALLYASPQVSQAAKSDSGRTLIYASVPIWLTNIIVFGLWYWELDRGGPAERSVEDHGRPDFLFPQMATPASSGWWTPKFFDYLYTSFTNATAFSPTDTMPLTVWAKALMGLQSLASLLTVALVVSRAVNILN